MCCLYGFHASGPTKVECSLVYAQNALLSQSRRERRGQAHADGWGIVCYDEGLPTVQRRSTTAFDDAKFSATAERTYSKTVMAHVRLATVGASTPLNTHPFTHDRWTFVHNGTIPRFAQLAPEMVTQTNDRLQDARLGGTDSEQFFLWLLTRLMAAGVDFGATRHEADVLAESLSDAIASLAQRCREVAPDETEKLNFILTDGKTLVACRWNNSLHWLHRLGIHDCEACGIPHIHHDKSQDYKAVVVASEPITAESWSELPNHTLLFIDPDITVARHSIPCDAGDMVGQ
jgi:glutamine amidotransferase